MADMKELTDANPNVVDAPFFKQEYLGEWFVDTDKLVYKYTEDQNALTDQVILETFYNEEKRHQYQYVLGIDFGFTDSMAFSICAYNTFDSHMYVVETFKKAKMIISAVDKKITEFRAKYPISKFIVDNAAKQSVEELKQRFGHPLEAAQKQDKANFIAIMNSDLIMGKIKVLPGNDALIAEWQSLIWDDRSDRLQENSSCENHLSDSTLYAWRYCYNYLAAQKTMNPKPGSKESLDAWWKKEGEQITKRKEGSVDFWESDWSDDLFSKI